MEKTGEHCCSPVRLHPRRYLHRAVGSGVAPIGVAGRDAAERADLDLVHFAGLEIDLLAGYEASLSACEDLRPKFATLFQAAAVLFCAGGDLPG
jgi:hypothetical protein